jgi:hypothetical protein
MIKFFQIALFFTVIVCFETIAQVKELNPWKYRAGINLNGIRTRTLEVGGQALKNGKFIFNFNLGFAYQNPRNGLQTKAQKDLDNIALRIKTSGFFVKPGIQANLFTLANKFTKADLFIGTGFTQSWYKRKTTFTDYKPVIDIKKTGEFSGSNLAPYVSVGGNLRLLYNVYLDLGLQYNLTKAQTNDNITPARYDYIPGQGGNLKNSNKTTILLVARYQFD